MLRIEDCRTLPLSYARLNSIVKVLLLQQLDQDSNPEPLINNQA